MTWPRARSPTRARSPWWWIASCGAASSRAIAPPKTAGASCSRSRRPGARCFARRRRSRRSVSLPRCASSPALSAVSSRGTWAVSSVKWGPPRRPCCSWRTACKAPLAQREHAGGGALTRPGATVRAKWSTVAPRATAILLLALAPHIAAQAADTTDTSDSPRPMPGDIGLAGSPSTDGEQVSFITSTTGLPQIWAVSVASGFPGVPAPHQLTFTEHGVTTQAWSPAGGWIFYAADRGGTEREGYYLISPDGLEERELLAPDGSFREFGAWSPDGRRIAFSSTARDGSDFDVYIQDISPNGQSSVPKRVYEAVGDVTVAAWRPDGNALVLSRARGETTNDLYLLDLATGALDTLFAPDSAVSFRGISWTPDGRGFYLATDDGRDIAGLAYYDTTERALTWIGVGRHPVDEVSLSPDGRWLAWTDDASGASDLHLLDLRGTGSEQQP